MGTIKLSDGALKPGAGVNKNLPKLRISRYGNCKHRRLYGVFCAAKYQALYSYENG